MARRSETFGRHIRAAVKAIAALEGKTELIVREELGELIDRAAAAVVNREEGQLPTSPRELEIFAEIGVKRALFGPVWLSRMLEAAGYPDVKGVQGKYYSTAQSDVRPPRSSDNLPTPSYPYFISYGETFEQVLEGLGRRTPLVVIVGLGGTGKSSLALEAAVQTTRRNRSGTAASGPIFDSAVWISDRDQPGTTRLGHVLDEIARTLGHHGYTALEPRTKKAEVEQLLRLQRVLIVVDNVETISDPELLAWLLRLPDPSKALVTTRSYHPEFRKGAWLVELAGMSEQAVGELVTQIASQLKLTLTNPGPTEAAKQLLAVTGGNPGAIKLILGLVKYGFPKKLSLADVLQTLNDSRNELFADLYAQSWRALGPDGQLTLMALGVFPSSCDPASLAVLTELPSDRQELALARLHDLALLDAVLDGEATSAGMRLRVHPLTRAFANARLAEAPELNIALHQRWLDWCSAFAATHGGFTLDDIGRLSALDAEESTLYAAVNYAITQGRHREAIALIKSIEYYYHVRAYWSRKAGLYSWYVSAAEALGDRDEIINALALSIQMLSRQGQFEKAEPLTARLEQQIAGEQLKGTIAFAYHHTRGLYLLAQIADDPAFGPDAEGHWQWLLDHREGLADHMVAGAYFWLATAIARQGADTRARMAFGEAITFATANGFTRFVGRCQLGLAMLDLRAGDATSAARWLAASHQLARLDDDEQQAWLALGNARLAALGGELEQAREAYGRSIALFERMSLSQERSEALAELSALE